MVAVMIGVDPHKASHTAVVIGAAEEPLAELRVRASASQADRLAGRGASRSRPTAPWDRPAPFQRDGEPGRVARGADTRTGAVALVPSARYPGHLQVGPPRANW
jgi:hypothetical protein